MFTIYARNIDAFPGEANPPQGEVQLFTIPNQSEENRPFLNASVSNELSGAGSFEFSVDPKSKFAKIWRHMRSIVRVEYDGETIFYGRTLTVDRDTYRTRKIHCEGAYTFLMDSVFEGTKNGYNITAGEYIQNLLTAHNTCQANCPDKQIFPGEIPGNYSQSIEEIQKMPNETHKYANSRGYKTVKDWLDELPSNYGGFMRVRYNQNDGKLYLDWMKMYFNSAVNNQTMTVSKNTVDLSDVTEVENIFTHILPTGDKWNYSDGTSGGAKSGEHSITINIQESFEKLGASVTACPASADKGQTVVLSVTPPSKVDEVTGVTYYFAGWTVVSGGITITDNTFVMGDEDVVISAAFSTEGYSAKTKYYIAVSARAPYGRPSASRSTAEELRTIYLYANPFEGYTLKSWHVKEGNVQINHSGNSYSFVMPNRNVSIEAVYMPLPEIN